MASKKFSERRSKHRDKKSFRRDKQRIISRIPLIITPENSSESSTLKGLTLDISHSGLSFIVNRELSRSNKLLLQLNSNSHDTPISLDAKIVWKKTDLSQSGIQYGVHFDNFEETMKYQIEQVISDILASPIPERFSLLNKIEDFIYKKFIGNLIRMSKFGHSSTTGKANTGINFDYMYQNSAHGKLLFGKLIDKILLNLPAVKATRLRKDNIKKIIHNEIENNDLLQKSTRILDLCSGPARYIIEALHEAQNKQVEAVCLDADKAATEYGKIISDGLPIRFINGNILKLQHLKSFSKRYHWKPNLIIASGVFEYFDDTTAQKMLVDTYKMIENEGILVFATQNTNPSRKLMEKVCTTNRGENWLLHYRTIRQVRKWMIDIGFRSVVVSIDPWNMYEMCTGRKFDKI